MAIKAQHRSFKLTNKLYISFSGIYRRLDAKNFPEPKDGFDIAKIGDLIIRRAAEDLERERAQTESIKRDKQARALDERVEKIFNAVRSHVSTQAYNPERVTVTLRVTEEQARQLCKALKEIYR